MLTSVQAMPAPALQVLRFFCVWDDRRSLYGDRRPYRLHYFLEDQTVEVLETNEKNSGRDSFPVFLRRGPLPKAWPSCCCLPGLCLQLCGTLHRAVAHDLKHSPAGGPALS